MNAERPLTAPPIGPIATPAPRRIGRRSVGSWIL
jgi:hypothetical protein